MPPFRREHQSDSARRRTRYAPGRSGFEGSLEKRDLLTAASINFLRVHALEPVSGGVLRVDYEILDAHAEMNGLKFDFYRSADETLDPADKRIDQRSVTEAERIAPGWHQFTFDLGDSLRPDPSRPFVILVGQAAGDGTEAELSDNSASFRKYTVAAISHGGIQGSHYDIPRWEAKIGRRLQDYGYDSVIAFNWANQSRTPGAAAKQAPRLGRRILQEIATFPQGASVDIDYIAHSQGTVVVSQAAIWMEKNADPASDTGYKRMTLLDPHAANPKAPNNAESLIGGFLGRFVKTVISWYKGNARDPLVRVPKSIHEADVYYQRTPVDINPVNGGYYNLLGQVPVLGTARYVQLNSPGIAHSGGGGVYTWFYFNALPFYATGDKPTNPSILAATSVRATKGSWNRHHMSTSDARPEWIGVSAPFATVKLYLSAADKFVEESRPVATTTADASGNWALRPDRNIPPGAYQVNVRAFLPAGLPRANTQLMPTIRLGTLGVRSQTASRKSSLPDAKVTLSIPKSVNKNGLGLRLNDDRQTFDPRNRIRP